MDRPFWFGLLKFHVKWYPWEKLASMFYDKQLGPMMEKSLVNLRNELEKASTECRSVGVWEYKSRSGNWYAIWQNRFSYSNCYKSYKNTKL